MGSSPELAAGQLLSLAPPSIEVASVARDLLTLRPTLQRKLSKWTMDNLEKSNVKINHKASASSFVISKLSKLEPDQSQDESTGYYANYVTGEVFAVQYPTLRVAKIMENYADTDSPSPLFMKVRDFVVRNSLNSRFQIFEVGPSEIIIQGGISETMEENFWSIHSSSKWTLQASSTSGYSLGGEISVRVHYFENCNFHYKIGPVKINTKHGISDIEMVFDRISAKHQRLKLRISNQCVFNDAEFENAGNGGSAQSSGKCSAVMGIQPTSIVKKLRRQLPVHKAKFDWNIARINLMSTLS
jgi:hypothetical protein